MFITRKFAAILKFVVLLSLSTSVYGKVHDEADEWSNERFELSGKELKNLTRRTSPEEYVKYVNFKYYKNGLLTYIGDGVNSEVLAQTGCTAGDNFAFILHGWRQNCESEWIPLLIAKLVTYRGGCIVCVDYGNFAQESYVRLARQYEPLTNIITEKLKYLQTQGFDPQKGYIFGFSFGGQLAVGVGRQLGPGLIKEIDSCDMAGPGFDYKGRQIDNRDAAQNVQCIHTTRDKGTRYYNCHQNWRMGNCGYSQPAAKDPPRGSHGLCPYIYISAFEHDFFAVRTPDKCNTKKPAQFWPQNFKMGYMEARKQLVNGELFALTSAMYPFNVVPDYAQYPLQGAAFYDQHQSLKGKPVLKSIIKARNLLKRRFQ